MEVTIRNLEEKDVQQAWELMRDLAVFENYIDVFAITPEIVLEKGLKKSPPDFYCLVADTDNGIVGILVYYFLPYTAKNTTAIYMKELIVKDDFRGHKIGEQLMDTLKAIAKENKCSNISWGVVPWNKDGMRFYERLGGEEEKNMLTYNLSADKF
jgi:ribosomal protein S18 acetylase RimI-like enzyme